MIQKLITKKGLEITFEPYSKWVRVMFGGEIVADSRQVYLLLPGGPPYYYFPEGVTPLE